MKEVAVWLKWGWRFVVLLPALDGDPESLPGSRYRCVSDLSKVPSTALLYCSASDVSS